MMFLSYLFSRLLSVAALCFLLWGGGFAIFVGVVSSERSDTDVDRLSATEGAVVLTGGSERIDAGLTILAAGKAKQLLISGVHPETPMADITQHMTLAPALVSCCLRLGKVAETTEGNAVETSEWAQSKGITSLRVITANYHMPRSLLLFRRSMPNVTMLPYAVTPDRVVLTDLWRHPGTLRLLAIEYTKYLSVLLFGRS